MLLYALLQTVIGLNHTIPTAYFHIVVSDGARDPEAKLISAIQ